MKSSSNGVSRGQLRFPVSGRSPPFIICGLFVVLLIFGYKYWNLSVRYNIIQKNLFDLEDNMKMNAKKNELLTKQNEDLNEKLQLNEAIVQRTKSNVVKKDEELNQLSNQLRHKEEEVNRLNSQIETLKNDADKCKENADNFQNEFNNAKGKLKELETENSNLKEKIATFEQAVNVPRKESELIKSKSIKLPLHNEITSMKGDKNDYQIPIKHTEKTDRKSELLDPDVGAPPNNIPETS